MPELLRDWLTYDDLERIRELRGQGLTWPVIGERLGYVGQRRVRAIYEAARRHIRGERKRYPDLTARRIEALIAEHEAGGITLTAMARREGRTREALSAAFTAAGYDGELRQAARMAGRPRISAAPRLISRADAKRLGLTRYCTGLPCIAGHVDERRTNNGECIACYRERKRERRAETEAGERQRG